MKLSDVPKFVLEALYERGHTDDVIVCLQPRYMLKEYLEWNGIIGYDVLLWDAVIQLQKLGDK